METFPVMDAQTDIVMPWWTKNQFSWHGLRFYWNPQKSNPFQKHPSWNLFNTKKKNVPDSRKPPGRIQEYYHKVIQRAEYYLAQLSENESW